MSEKKSNLLLPLVGGLVVIAGGIGAYLFYKQMAPSGVGGAMETAKLVPKQVQFAMSITGDSNAWAQLEQFQSPEVKKYVDDEIKKLEKSFSSGDINFTTDIKPWAGDVMLAVLPSSATVPKAQLTPRTIPISTAIAQAPEVGKDFDILMVVQVKDKAAGLKFFDKAKAQSKVTEKDYKGVQISELASNKTGNNISIAVVGDYSIYSNKTSTLQKSIDTFQGQESVATAIAPDNLGLKTTLVQFYAPDFPSAVENLAKLSSSNPSGQPIPPQTLAQLKLVKSLTIGLGVDSEGIRLKGITNLDPNFLKIEPKNSPAKVISQFPPETFALVSGIDIKSRWEQFNKDTGADPEVKKQLDEIRTGLKSSPVGLDLDKDIFGWMDGEYALGAITSTEGLLAQSGAAPALILQTSNRSAAEETFKKLDAFVKTNGLEVTTKDIKGVSVTEWSSPQTPGFALGRGWYEQDKVFISVGALIGVMAKPSTTLDSTPEFKAVTGSLDKSNIGYFYLDMDKTWAWYSGRFIPPSELATIPAEAKALIKTIRGIGATASIPSKTLSTFEILVSLKPKGGV